MREYEKMSMPEIALPVDKPSPKELERRRKAAEKILALRGRIGPIGIRASDLLREFREEKSGE